MKKVIVGCLLMIGSAAVQADQVRLVPADDSQYTQVCLAATKSDAVLQSTITELGLDQAALKEIDCNGRPLARFARQHRDVSYNFKLEDASAESRLCYAAVTSLEDFESIRAERFADVLNLEQEVSCNGMSLARFISRYADLRRVTAAR